MSAPALRTQHDGDQAAYSADSALDCSDSPDRTRQEHKQETDITYILSRFGANTFSQPAQFGEADFDLDLQQAMAAIVEAKNGFRSLPKELRVKYRGWRDMLNAAAAGDLDLAPTKPPVVTPPVPGEVPPAAG